MIVSDSIYYDISIRKEHGATLGDMGGEEARAALAARIKQRE